MNPTPASGHIWRTLEEQRLLRLELPQMWVPITPSHRLTVSVD